MEHSYYLTFRRRKQGGELSFNVGSRDKRDTLLRLRGGNTEAILTKILSTLSRAGCITPIQTGNPSLYWVRDDVGPVLGTYLILVKRGRNTDYWANFFDELLTGKYSRLGAMFSTLLESAIDLSKDMSPKSPKAEYSLSPTIISSFSSALKTFIKTLKRQETRIKS